jgi:CBS domain-containing membrane protein
MNKPVRTINPDTPLAEIIEDMCREGRRCLPVAGDDGRVQGLVTVFDIFMALQQPSYRK